MSKSLELLDKIVEKYNWLGKEYCRLIGKGDELHKFNQTVFVECLVTPIKQDLEGLEELEKENEDLKVFVDAYANARDELLIRNEQLEKENLELKEQLELKKFKEFILLNGKLDKLEKAIEIIKNHDIRPINHLGTLRFAYNEFNSTLTQQEYELLKEILN